MELGVRVKFELEVVWVKIESGNLRLGSGLGGEARQHPSGNDHHLVGHLAQSWLRVAPVEGFGCGLDCTGHVEAEADPGEDIGVVPWAAEKG